MMSVKLEKPIISVVCTLVLLISLVMAQEFEPKDYCTPEKSCWPSQTEFDQLKSDNPTMEVVQKGDADWEKASNLVLNYRVSKIPGATIYAKTTGDIIAAVNFSQVYDMNLKIIVTGHEFIGRNTAEGCLQLSVARMNSITTDLNCAEHSDGCLTVEPGTWWLQAYEAADSVNRVIMGGQEPSVSVTGWMLGGGHSPFSPKLGLGVDQVIEVKMVLADLSVVTLTNTKTSKLHVDGTVTTSNDTDLFWAIRGGGGGTFGVVTLIKYKLHRPPSKLTVRTCAFSAVSQPLKAMKNIKKGMNKVMQDLPDEFGGYMLTGSLCYTVPCKMAVYATYIFIHWGAVSENQVTFDEMDSTISKLSEYLLTGPCTTIEYDSYYEFVLTLPNVTYQTIDMDGTFLSKSEYNDAFVNKESNILAAAFHAKKYFSSTWIRLGGKTMDTSSGATAVNPLFRNAMWTVAYGGEEQRFIKGFDRVVERTVDTKGQYFSECDDDLPPGEWQRQFWGDSYSRLLEIKRKYDSDNHFTCKQCVGSSGHLFAPYLAFILSVFTLVVSL